MAAVAAVAALLNPGDALVASDDLYGGTYRYFENFARPAGIRVSYADTSRSGLMREILSKEKIRALFIESPTNPTMKITDLRRIVLRACQRRGDGGRQHLHVAVVAAAFAAGSGYRDSQRDKIPCRPQRHLVRHCRDEYPRLSKRIAFAQNAAGGVLSPFDSWLVLRGLKTLAVRMERSQANARKIAAWLCRHRRVAAVYFPGLAAHPGYALHKRQARGPGSIISFRMRNARMATAVLRRVETISFAESLGGVETLITQSRPPDTHRCSRTDPAMPGRHRRPVAPVGGHRTVRGFDCRP